MNHFQTFKGMIFIPKFKHMKKSQILLSLIGLFALVGGSYAFKIQKRYLGLYFCTAVYTCTAKFNTLYTTIAGNVTLYCTLDSHACPTVTRKVRINA